MGNSEINSEGEVVAGREKNKTEPSSGGETSDSDSSVQSLKVLSSTDKLPMYCVQKLNQRLENKAVPEIVNMVN